LREGSIEEKREIISFFKGEIYLKQKQVGLGKV
jgi:hypothetical protein